MWRSPAAVITDGEGSRLPGKEVVVRCEAIVTGLCVPLAQTQASLVSWDKLNWPLRTRERAWIIVLCLTKVESQDLGISPTKRSSNVKHSESAVNPKTLHGSLAYIRLVNLRVSPYVPSFSWCLARMPDLVGLPSIQIVSCLVVFCSCVSVCFIFLIEQNLRDDIYISALFWWNNSVRSFMRK